MCGDGRVDQIAAQPPQPRQSAISLGPIGEGPQAIEMTYPPKTLAVEYFYQPQFNDIRKVGSEEITLSWTEAL